jgi:hypothetical protein
MYSEQINNTLFLISIYLSSIELYKSLNPQKSTTSKPLPKEHLQLLLFDNVLKVNG